MLGVLGGRLGELGRVHHLFGDLVNEALQPKRLNQVQASRLLALDRLNPIQPAVRCGRARSDGETHAAKLRIPPVLLPGFAELRDVDTKGRRCAIVVAAQRAKQLEGDGGIPRGENGFIGGCAQGIRGASGPDARLDGHPVFSQQAIPG